MKHRGLDDLFHPQSLQQFIPACRVRFATEMLRQLFLDLIDCGK
jgi:hypothetical protein